MVVWANSCNEIHKGNAARAFYPDVVHKLLYAMEALIRKMKEDYDSLHLVLLEEYQKLWPFLEIKTYPKKSVLKVPGTTEDRSRYIFEGVIAMYYHDQGNAQCSRIYSKTDTVCDFESYAQAKSSSVSFVALTDCVVCELKVENELAVVDTIPSFGSLAIRINHRITARDCRWKNLLILPNAEKYRKFQEQFPKYGFVSVKDTAALLNIPERTLSRIRGIR